MSTPITVYANLADFQATGLPSTALTGVDDTVINQALLNASDMITDSLSSQFTLPLVQIGNSIKQYTIDLAALLILDSVGEAPEGQAYQTWKKRADRAYEWCRQVREREIHPAGCIDSSSPLTNIQPGPQATPLRTPWNPRGLGRW